MKAKVRAKGRPIKNLIAKEDKKKNNSWLSLIQSKSGYLLLLGVVLFAVGLNFLFTSKISIAGDDASYLEAMNEYVTTHHLSSFEGSFYILFLSLVFKLFGYHIVLFKLLSAVGFAAFFVLLYFSLRKHYPVLLLLGVLFIFFINKSIFFYSSYTNSEGFFMLWVGLLTICFIHFFANKPVAKSVGSQLAQHLLIGVLIICCYIARNVGLYCAGAVWLYFFCYREWKNLFWSIGGFIAAYGGYLLILHGFFEGVPKLQFVDELNLMLAKDPYNVEGGRDNFWGILGRFWGNSKEYIGAHFYTILGFLPATYYTTALETAGPWAILSYLLLIPSVLISYKNRAVFFISCMAACALLVTFFILQTFYNQDRLILVHMPFLIVVMIYGLYAIPTHFKRYRTGVWLSTACVGLLLITGFLNTSKAINDFAEERDEERAGNMFAGYTPDWQNYLQMGVWAAANTPANSGILCRKSAILLAYTGRKFVNLNTQPKVSEEALMKTIANSVDQFYSIEVETSQPKRLDNIIARFAGSLQYAVIWKSSTIQSQQMSFIFAIKNNETKAFEALCKQENMNALPVLADIMNNKKAGLAGVFYPYAAMEDLIKSNHVDYIIAPSLRANPKEKTDRIITTIELFKFLLSVKYPSILSFVKRIGDDEYTLLLQIKRDMIK